MSTLGSLFGGSGAADNNDALKYSAPKEPKKSQAATPVGKAAPVAAAAGGGAGGVAPSKPTAAASSSKILVATTVRLYKTNASGAYDAVEGGAPLGCLIMGGGLVYQILIYNGQKVPQCTTPLSPSFDYNVRDLYLSFTDHQQQNWSILFDSLDNMSNFVRSAVACIVHIASNSDPASFVPGALFGTLRRALPSNAGTASSAEPNSDSVVVAANAGISAGVYLTAWEVGDAGEEPSAVYNKRPIKQVQPPQGELVKVKVGATDEVLAGLNAALVGCRKGDKIMLGVSPKVFYEMGTGGIVEAASRLTPAAWLLVEVEVVKTKSGADKGDKKKKDKSAAAAPAVAESPTVDSGDSDLKARMASLSKQSGGGGAQLAAAAAGIRGRELSIDETAPSPPRDRDRDRDRDNRDRDRDRDRRSRSPDYRERERERERERDREREKERERERERERRRREDEEDRERERQRGRDRDRDRGRDNWDRGRDNRDRERDRGDRDQYALAVVEGQEVRSYYDDAGSGSGPGANSGAGGGAGSLMQFTQLQQSIMVVQQSMMQLHTKMDGLGGRMTQQLPPAQGMYGAGMYGSAQQPYGGMGGMMNMGGGGVRQRTQELMAGLQQIVAEHEQLQQQAHVQSQQQNMGSAADKELLSATQKKLQDAQSEMDAQTRSINRLTERNETLQGKLEKLVDEKERLLERQSELVSSNSNSSSQLYALNQEVESLRRVKAESGPELESLRSRVVALQRELDEATSGNSSGNRAADAAAAATNAEQCEALTNRISELETRVSALQSEVVEANAARRRAEEGAVSVADKEKAVADAAADAEARVRREMNEEIEALKKQLSEALQAAASEQPDLESEAVQAHVAAAVKSALAAADDQSVPEVVHSLRAEIGALTERLAAAEQAKTAAVEAAAAAAGSGRGSGSGSPDVKQIMQDIYGKAGELFVPQDDSGNDLEYTSKDVLKRLRSVLKQVSSANA